MAWSFGGFAKNMQNLLLFVAKRSFSKSGGGINDTVGQKNQTPSPAKGLQPMRARLGRLEVDAAVLQVTVSTIVLADLRWLALSCIVQ